MISPLRPLVRFWHLFRVRPRLGLSILVALLVFAWMHSGLGPSTLGLWTRILITWDIGAGLYLVLAWMLMVQASVERMRWRARIQDDGAAVILTLTVAAALFSLAAILRELPRLKASMPGSPGVHLALGLGTFLASWLLVHTSFALHYAHAYYASHAIDGSAPLEFPRQESPVYLDFLYFSMTIGMTSQTADVSLATTRMRRLVMAHGMISFLFNTTLLALTINIAAGLLS